MQETLIQQSAYVVVRDPAQRMKIYLWIICGFLLVLDLGLIFLPGLGSASLRGSKSFYLTQFLILPFILLWLLAMTSPFLNMPGSSKWKQLEKRRQEAVKKHLDGESVSLSAFPRTSMPFPEVFAVRVRRNWLVTGVASLLYLLLLGLILALFIADWQTTMQSVAQEAIPAGTVFGVLFNGLFGFLLTLPIAVIFAFAPQQQIIATSEALICQRGLRFRYIPWRQARLFAVIEKQKDTIVYELASGTNLIRWSSKPGFSITSAFPAATMGIAPFGLVRTPHSAEAYRQRIQELTAIVATRTGLPLYDLCSSVSVEMK